MKRYSILETVRGQDTPNLIGRFGGRKAAIAKADELARDSGWQRFFDVKDDVGGRIIHVTCAS